MEVQISILWPTHIKSQKVSPITTSNDLFNMPGTIWNNIQCSLVKNIGEVVYHNPSQAHVKWEQMIVLLFLLVTV